jgi:hypothetical protein
MLSRILFRCIGLHTILFGRLHPGSVASRSSRSGAPAPCRTAPIRRPGSQDVSRLPKLLRDEPVFGVQHLQLQKQLDTIVGIYRIPGSHANKRSGPLRSINGEGWSYSEKGALSPPPIRIGNLPKVGSPSLRDISTLEESHEEAA